MVLVLPKERRWSGKDRRKAQIHVALERREQTRRTNDELVRDIIDQLRENQANKGRHVHAVPAVATVIPAKVLALRPKQKADKLKRRKPA